MAAFMYPMTGPVSFLAVRYKYGDGMLWASTHDGASVSANIAALLRVRNETRMGAERSSPTLD
ncbi:MAG TPA: hypothetical protein DC060_19380 [Gemmatimonadetes bacterium]|nr:hypothetical protein [Gemmatimonadota bacterium]HBE00342.1 hypothetical protein [Gemmatimonadota bacterium]